MNLKCQVVIQAMEARNRSKALVKGASLWASRARSMALNASVDNLHGKGVCVRGVLFNKMALLQRSEGCDGLSHVMSGGRTSWVEGIIHVRTLSHVQGFGFGVFKKQQVFSGTE